MSSSRLRIKLDFCNNSTLLWTFCDLNKTKTINDFCKDIAKKHDLKKIELMLDDAILPPQEPISILENGDIIKIIKSKKINKKRKCSSSSSSSSENEIIEKTNQCLKPLKQGRIEFTLRNYWKITQIS